MTCEAEWTCVWMSTQKVHPANPSAIQSCDVCASVWKQGCFSNFTCSTAGSSTSPGETVCHYGIVCMVLMGQTGSLPGYGPGCGAVESASADHAAAAPAASWLLLLLPFSMYVQASTACLSCLLVRVATCSGSCCQAYSPCSPHWRQWRTAGARQCHR
jgi:hypothetical protein